MPIEPFKVSLWCERGRGNLSHLFYTQTRQMSDSFILFIPSIISLFERAYSVGQVIAVVCGELEYCYPSEEEIDMINKLNQIVFRA